jgi:hypothetical protein
MGRTQLEESGVTTEVDGNEAGIANRVMRHRDWLLCVELADARAYPFVCEGTRRGGERKSTPRFANALSALAYAVTRIDCNDWK